MAEGKTKEDLDLFELFLKVIRIFIAHFWLIFYLTIGCVALAVVDYFVATKVYESRMIVSSSILTDSYVKVLFENASKHLLQGNVEVIAEQLHISKSTAGEIAGLEIENLSSALSNNPKENERFVITAQVFDSNILPELQKGLVSYLENNEFVRVRVEQNRAFFKEMLNNVDKEIQDMEEFKRRISSGDFFESTRGNVMFDPTTVNSKILELKEKKLGYQNSLQLSNSVQVIDGFTKFSKHSKPKLSVLITIGLVSGLIVSGAIIFFKVVRGLLSEPKRAN